MVSPTRTAAPRVDDIVVTGMRAQKGATVAGSPAPIDVVTSGQLSRTGRADLSESLSRLLPAFGFGTATSGLPAITRPVFNRGLGPAYTLVLVNGKRRHNGALLTNGGGDTSGANPVDLDQLPSSSIAEIQVLKDSAAAQYGSDAVAGVINVLLKDQDHGAHAALQGGSLYAGQGDPRTFKLEADAGLKLGSGGFLHLSGDARRRGLSWNNFLATSLPFSPASNPLNANWNGDGSHNGDPEIRSYALSFNAEYPVDGSATLYANGTFGQRSTVIGNSFRRPNSTANVNQIFPQGFFPVNNSAETDGQLLSGVRGSWADTKWDLSLSYGQNVVRQYSDRTINASLGTGSPTSFGDLAGYRFEQWVANLDLNRDIDIGLAAPVHLSGGLEYRLERFSTYAGDVLGYLDGGYRYRPGDQPGDPNVGNPAAIGAQAAIILTPADEVRLTRGDLSAYLDVAVRPVPQWFVGLAGRVEHYGSAVGNTVGFKINSRYDVSSWLAVRGTVGTGFRAPSLGQIGYAQTDNRLGTDPITGAIALAYTKLASPGSALARALGARDLKAERSTNFGLGVIFTPAKDLSITADGYQITIDHRVVRTGNLFGPALARVLQANGLPGSTWVSYFANAIDTRTRGVDVVADWKVGEVAKGKLDLTVAFNYNRTSLTHIGDTPEALKALGSNPGGSLIFLPRAAAGDLTVNLPATKLILAAEWNRGPVGLNIRTSRYGRYDYVRSEVAAQDTHYGARWITDLTIDYRLLRNVMLTGGASNFFNVYPTRGGRGDPVSGAEIFVYGPAPFSPFGGYYYGRMSWNF